MKLFIDDIRTPPSDGTWHICRTVTAAIRAIHQFSSEIEEISFDHDISHQIGMGEMSRPYPCAETFLPVVHYLGLMYSYYEAQIKNGEAAPIWSPKITIHTSNPVGAKEMEAVLKLYNLSAHVELRGPANRLETIL